MHTLHFWIAGFPLRTKTISLWYNRLYFYINVSSCCEIYCLTGPIRLLRINSVFGMSQSIRAWSSSSEQLVPVCHCTELKLLMGWVQWILQELETMWGRRILCSQDPGQEDLWPSNDIRQLFLLVISRYFQLQFPGQWTFITTVPEKHPCSARTASIPILSHPHRHGHFPSPLLCSTSLSPCWNPSKP